MSTCNLVTKENFVNHYTVSVVLLQIDFNRDLFNHILRVTSDYRLASVAQLDAHLTADQEVAGLTLAGLATFFHEDLIMKYFLRSFSPFH